MKKVAAGLRRFSQNPHNSLIFNSFELRRFTSIHFFSKKSPNC